jgi:hypothetical protein
MSSELIKKRDSSRKESSATFSVSVEGRSHIRYGTYRRTRIIIHNLTNPSHKPLMRKININLVTTSLFVVMIIT